jgi:hypothetical protein
VRDMPTSKDLTREDRIKRELSRLRRSLKPLVQANKYKAADGLMQRAAFLRIELEDLEEDINIHGTTEPGLQGTKVRASAQQYDKLLKTYNSVCKQLNDLIPATAGSAPKQSTKESETPDPFLQIMGRRQSTGGMRRVK